MDNLNGVEVPQLVLVEDYTLTGVHNGTIHVAHGTLTIQGELKGTLDVQKDAKVLITGIHKGTVSIAPGAEVIVSGVIKGTTTVEFGSLLVVEAGGKLAGFLNNHGEFILRGVFGGPLNGLGKVVIEDTGYIKKPIIKNGIEYYEWK